MPEHWPGEDGLSHLMFVCTILVPDFVCCDVTHHAIRLICSHTAVGNRFQALRPHWQLYEVPQFLTVPFADMYSHAITDDARILAALLIWACVCPPRKVSLEI